jgi:hypothetical protein
MLCCWLVILDTQAEPEKTVLYVIEDVPLFYNTPAPKGSKARHTASATCATFATYLPHNNRTKVAQTVRHCGALHHASSCCTCCDVDLRRVMSHVLRCSNNLAFSCSQYPARLPRARRCRIATLTTPLALTAPLATPLASPTPLASYHTIGLLPHHRPLTTPSASYHTIDLWRRCNVA